jgi:hypothetical protein
MNAEEIVSISKVIQKINGGVRVCVCGWVWGVCVCVCVCVCV